MDNYTYMSLVNFLGYDIVRFQMYISYVNSINKDLVIFERFLLDSDNLKEFEKDPRKVKDAYCARYGYDSFDSLPDYYSYELFCRSFQINMYDESLIDSKRSCDNCVFSRECVSLDGSDKYLGCLNRENYEEVAPDYECDFHVFDSNKIDALISEYKLERKKHNN